MQAVIEMPKYGNTIVTLYSQGEEVYCLAFSKYHIDFERPTADQLIAETYKRYQTDIHETYYRERVEGTYDFNFERSAITVDKVSDLTEE